MKGIYHIDLFSGIGGFALAASWLGWKTIAHSEVEPFCCKKVYHRHFPDSECLGDVRKVDWHGFKKKSEGARVVITAGFPCQPSSCAGRRQGEEDERDLWPECARAVRELRPDYALFENVPGILTVNGGRYYNRIMSDLAACGYNVEWMPISAKDVGAPHLRKRIWIVAYPDEGFSKRPYNKIQAGRDAVDGCGEAMAYPKGQREMPAQQPGRGRGSKQGGADLADASLTGQQALRYPSISGLPDWAGGEVEQPWPLTQLERSDERETFMLFCDLAPGLPDRLVPRGRRYTVRVRDRVSKLKALGNAIVPQCAYVPMSLIDDAIRLKYRGAYDIIT